MIFGDTPLEEARDAILAHSVSAGRARFRKGRRLGAEDIALLREAGVTSVVAARLERGDVHEDEAAERIAVALAGAGLRIAAPFTGRVNLFAEADGVVKIDADRLDRLNRIDESITVATVPDYAELRAGQMAATVKIIPFAAPYNALLLAEAMARLPERGAAIRLAPYRPLKIAMVQTQLPATKPGVLDKTVEITRRRIEELGCTLVAERRCTHHVAALAAEIQKLRGGGADIVLVVGASAITDRRDVIPAAVEAAGGTVEHFGMPVDPGNLLLSARIGATPVLGLPGCARSPKINGFDLVLRRIVAGLAVTRLDLMAMGVGGLLTEIPSRPQPREGAPPPTENPRAPRVAAIVLAAGQSRRMGPENKLLMPVEGVPMVRRTVEAARAAAVSEVVVVTGHEAEAVAGSLAGLDLRLVHNPRYAEGLSTSLAAGIAALPEEVDAALILLGDMPRISARLIDRLIAAYAPAEGRSIIVPTAAGKRGNPILWDRRFFPEMRELAGDVGARHLIGANEDAVTEVECGDRAVLLDVDTPEAFAALAGAGAGTGAEAEAAAP